MGNLPIEWDRCQLERGEARILARSFNGKEWLDKALKASERVYGKGSSERIREHMKQIWKQELLK